MATRSGRLAVLSALGIGAGLMYVLDPYSGARRRALVRDKLVHLSRALRVGAFRTERDVWYRTRGLAHRVRSRIQPGPAPDDEILLAHIRAEIGRYVSHPRSIDAAVRGGAVTLSGPILEREVPHLLIAIRRIRGVRNIDNRLEAHANGDRIPALQGEGQAKRVPPFDMFGREHWPPAARLLASSIGAFLVLHGRDRRREHGGLTGIASVAAGAALLLRAVTNSSMRSILGVADGGHAIDLQRTFTIHAPIERVFALWTNVRQFPRVMEHVLEVRPHDGGGRSRWTVAGPAGSHIHWEAELTRLEPNRLVAWKTLPGSAVEHAGVIRFEALGDGSTRVDIRISYNPPAGTLGHAVAKLFHKDPKAAMNDDLVRMKSLLEDGKATAHGHTVTLDQLR
jgi:uncharacterized membrane protein